MKSDITVVLDRSGSMKAMQEEVKGSFTKFIEDQRKVEGEATLSIVQFDAPPGDDWFDWLVKDSDIHKKKVNGVMKQYKPRGCTALNDAACMAIDATGERLEATPQQERPDKIVFVIVTDGHENRSREFTHEDVKKRVQRQTDVYKWDFVYLSADVNAFDAGDRYGVNADNVAEWHGTERGSRAMLCALSDSVASVRRGSKADMGWTPAERKSMNDAE